MGVHDEFPEPTIQLIQSLLTEREAAQTTILSKSWHSAWLTRPHLDLDDTRFDGIKAFSIYAMKTIKRYEQSNLKIQNFKLHMKIACFGSAVLAEKLISKALKKLGATSLSFRLNNNSHNNYYHSSDSSRFSLSPEVLFGAENLVELSVEGCREMNLDGVVIKCCGLESLCLDKVNTNMVSKIIMSCPLIENLSLSNIYNSHDQLYRYVDGWDWEGVQQVAEGPPRSTAATIDNNLHRLRCLVLCYESFKALFRGGDSLSKFPLLADFTLHMKDGEEDVQISNCSLERIKIELPKVCFEDARRPKVKLDVPSVRKFTFLGGDVIPSLTFSSTSSSDSNWESHVSIKRNAGFAGFWFHELNEFLTELRQSKIHLSLHVQCIEGIDYRAGDLSFARKHEVESLEIDTTGLPPLSCYALFDGLFRLCRPKMITQQNPCKDDWDDEGYQNPRRGTRRTNIDFLCHVLEQGKLVKEMIPTQFMYGLSDLEEVNAQVFDVHEWRPIPLNSLLFDEEHHYRFLLKWKP